MDNLRSPCPQSKISVFPEYSDAETEIPLLPRSAVLAPGRNTVKRSMSRMHDTDLASLPVSPARGRSSTNTRSGATI